MRWQDSRIAFRAVAGQAKLAEVLCQRLAQAAMRTQRLHLLYSPLAVRAIAIIAPRFLPPQFHTDISRLNRSARSTRRISMSELVSWALRHVAMS